MKSNYILLYVKVSYQVPPFINSTKEPTNMENRQVNNTEASKIDTDLLLAKENNQQTQHQHIITNFVASTKLPRISDALHHN